MSWAEDEGYDVYDGEDFTIHSTLKLDVEALRLYWTTKDAQKIFIEDMDTQHIERLIRMDMDGRIDMAENTQDRFLLELSIRRRLEKNEFNFTQE